MQCYHVSVCVNTWLDLYQDMQCYYVSVCVYTWLDLYQDMQCYYVSVCVNTWLDLYQDMQCYYVSVCLCLYLARSISGYAMTPRISPNSRANSGINAPMVTEQIIPNSINNHSGLNIYIRYYYQIKITKQFCHLFLIQTNFGF